MKPPIPYFGGKSRLAPWIASMLPPHRVYVEPFMGSAAVLFAKPPAPAEVLNDSNGNVVCFFRVLRERPAELEAALRLTPYARDEYTAARLDVDDIDDLERARRFFVRATQSMQANVRDWTSWRSSARRHSNVGPGTVAIVDRLAACAERLSACVIDNRPASKVIELYGLEDAVIYADPPYLRSTRYLERGNWGGKARDYEHDMHSEAEHRELADQLRAVPAAVLLSGYPSPLYEELYGDWYRVERGVTRPSSNRPGRSGAMGLEVVWSNRPLSGSLWDAVGRG